MREISISEIEKAVDAKNVRGNRDLSITGVCIDSRKADKDFIMFCIEGEKTDGHLFIDQAAKQGATVFAVKEGFDGEVPKGCVFIETEDTTVALQKLAAYYMKSLNMKKIAVTGSVGKTTTRDMIHRALSTKYKSGKNFKNYNSEYGLPLTVFSFDDTIEAAVLEMGMDGPGQIHDLVEIVKPDIAVITNVGISHIERLGSRKGICDAKMEITDFFGKDNLLIINENGDMLMENKKLLKTPYRVEAAAGMCDFPECIYFDEEIREKSPGLVSGNIGEDYFIKHIDDKGDQGVDFIMIIKGVEYPVSLNLPGAHNAMNAALAVAAATAAGVDVEDAIKAVELTELTGNRLKITEKNGIKVIDDTYNAAPDSMKSALATLSHTEADRRIAVLGDMNELGDNWEKEHREVGRSAVFSGADVVIGIGEKGRAIAEGAMAEFEKRKPERPASVCCFNTREDFYTEAEKMFRSGDVVLLKASRSLELEKLVEKILKG